MPKSSLASCQFEYGGSAAASSILHVWPCSRYQEALQESPAKEEQRAILANLALAYTKAGRYEEAMSVAKQAIAISPAWDKAHYRLGMALVEARRCPEAVEPLKQACLLSKGKPGQSILSLSSVLPKCSPGVMPTITKQLYI